ncbi:MAG: hypothetical protein AB1529_05655, partial [Candidatus Micrarchaeota archaeon]
ASAYCNFQDYNRMLCKNTQTGKWVRCSCDAAAKRCLGQRTNISYHDNEKPTDAAGLNEHLEGYKDGERYYHINRLPVSTITVSVDPDCSVGGTLEGADSINVGAYSGGNVYELVAAGRIVPTEEQAGQLVACQASGATSQECQDLINTLLNQLPASASANEVLDVVQYPNDVSFFGSTQQGYIGYTLLSEGRFQQTDFYKECHPSYDIINGVQQFGGVTLDPNNPAYGGDALEERDDVVNAVYSAKLFTPPDMIPGYLGWDWAPSDNHIECHWDGDDWGNYRYVPHYLLIKDTGICEFNSDQGVPVTKSFGWCEPCSYATIAKQYATTDPDVYYSPDQRTNYTGSSKTSSVSGDVCEPSFGFGIGYGSESYDMTCPTTDDPNRPDKGYDDYDFSGYPDAVYMQEKQVQYFKENIMPVIDLTSPGNWGEFGSLQISNAIIDRGPSVLIIDNVSSTFAGGSMLSAKISAAKGVCPSCVIAVRLSNGAANSRNASERVALDIAALERLNETNAPGVMDKVHMVTFQYYPNEYTKEFTDSCSLSDEEMFENIVYLLENTSRRIMVATERPTMVTEFGITGEGCWDKRKSELFLSNLLLKQKRLAKAGLGGIIYSDTSTLVSGSGYSDMFCGVEKGSRSLVSDERVTIFNKVLALPATQVKCDGCTDFDVTMGRCNRTCPNGVDCTADAQALTLAKQQLGLPAATPDDEVPVKCPNQAIPMPCTPCSESTEKIYCDFFRSDGTTLNATYNISDLSILEADIIASIPPPHACCLQDETGNYTYAKTSTTGKMSAPLMFSPSGDPREDCGVADLSSLEKPLCGVDLPIKNYKVECRIT